MSNQPPVQTPHMIDTASMNELATKMENNLAHATQVISDTLTHSRQLMAQIHHAHQQNQANYAQASSHLNQEQPNTQPESNAAINPVAQAVQNLAQQEQGALQHMQQQAQQHFQHAEQTLEGSSPQQAPPESHSHGLHGFAESVASTLHQGVEKGESMIQHMKLEAQKHMHDAEKSIQQSLSSIHHAIEGQGKMFAQQQAPDNQNKPSEPPQSTPTE